MTLRTLNAFRRPGESFEAQFPNEFDVGVRFSCVADIDVDQDLAVLGLGAQARSEIWHRSNGSVFETTFKADATECGITVSDANAETQLEALPAPLGG